MLFSSLASLQKVMEIAFCICLKRAFVVQVLEQLPDGLAVAVLSASPADLRSQLLVLPESLYPLAMDAAFPSIRQQHSLTLDFLPLTGRDTIMAAAVLHAATMVSSALKRVKLGSIPVQNSEHLLQLIPAACSAALDVRLEYGHESEVQVPKLHHIEQLGAGLAPNTVLTRLELSFHGQPYHGFHLEGLTDSLTGLHSLTLERGWHRAVQVPIPVPRSIGNLPHLTYLNLRHGFNLSNLPQILPKLAGLQELHVYCDKQQPLLPLAILTALQTLEVQMYDHHQIQQFLSFDVLTTLRSLELRGVGKVQQLPSLAALTALQTLRVRNFYDIQYLPRMATLTALQTLELWHLLLLQELPSLVSQTALETFILHSCKRLLHMPSLDALAALQTLDLNRCAGLQQLPPLSNLTALQTLSLTGCKQLQQLPSLGTLTALQTLRLHDCGHLQQLPSLASLTSLKSLDVQYCRQLQQLPPLKTLAALETLSFSSCGQILSCPPLGTQTALTSLSLSCEQLQHLPSLATLTALQTLFLDGCAQLKQLPPLATLTALQSLHLDNCRQLQQLPPLATLTLLQTLWLRSCVQLQTLPPLEALSMLQRLNLHGCENLQRGCLRLPCLRLPTESFEFYGVSAERLQDLQAEHVAEPTA
jgi:Leucine-rich repeat (LRR) protein